MTRRSLAGEGHASGTNDARTRANLCDIGICLIGVGRSQLARRLSSPPLECMSECAHLIKAEQPRNLGYMHLAIVEVTNRQIAPELLKYLTVVPPCVRELPCKRPLAHSDTASSAIPP